MRRRRIVLVVTLVAGIAAVAAWLVTSPRSRAPEPATPPATSLTAESGRYLFNVTLHTPEEIAGMLARAAQLARTAPADRRGPGIALVLHGPEIEIFARKNYARYRETVDRAERLDREGVVEVKMCRTEMKHLGVREEDVPDFVELVPYGPDEEARLRREGYVYF